MPVLTNNWTAQKPFTYTGETGAQMVRLIPACRAFLKAADSVTAAPVNTYSAFTFKTNGAIPSGWTDLGVMNGSGTITYNKNKVKVQTGIDKVVRGVYIDEKTAELAFTLSQLDDYLLNALGFSASVITAGSTKQYRIGKEDVVEKALLLVYANKLDGKEIHWYHPAAQLVAAFEESEGGMAISVTAELIAFTASGDTTDMLVSTTVFAA